MTRKALHTLSVLRAAKAASKAGIASARSPSHSSFRACDSEAFWLATASSFLTSSLRASTSADSFSITCLNKELTIVCTVVFLSRPDFEVNCYTKSTHTFIILVFSLAVSTSCGCNSSSSFCMSATYTARKTQKIELAADRSFTMLSCVNNAPEMQQMPASPVLLHNDACYASPATDHR